MGNSQSFTIPPNQSRNRANPFQPGLDVTNPLEQEVARLGGDYAHVIDEHVDSRRDDLTTESWLHGRFSYVLYRHGPARP